MMIRAVAFDLFGTLVRLNPPRHPYGQLLTALGATDEEKHLTRRWALTHKTNLDDIPAFLGKSVNQVDLDRARTALRAEQDEIVAYEDGQLAWKWVDREGLSCAIASNLATPYGECAARLLPSEPKVMGWSFAFGSAKPEVAFFNQLCQNLDLPAHEVLMVGDTINHDYHGAVQAGLKAVWLNRKGADVPAGVLAIGSLTQLPDVLDYVSRE